MILLWFFDSGIRVTQTSKDELESVPSSFIFWKGENDWC